MSAPASFLYTPAAVREIDRIAIEDIGIPDFELMGRAGRLVWDTARQLYPDSRRWLLLCGAGNNGGDGYVVATLARAAGLAVTVAALADPQRLRGAAARAWEQYRSAGGDVVQFRDDLLAGTDLVIDAIFGTGLARDLDDACRQAVEAVNAASVPVVAVDLPSGLDGASGRVLGAAMRADVTVTFIGRKQGLYLGAGPDHVGNIVFGDLGVPPARVAQVAPGLRLFDGNDLSRLLPRRARSAHKGNFGHVLVVGGNHGMAGAVRLAGEAALRAGAGLVSVATRPENVAPVIAGRPELMCRGVQGPVDLEDLLRRATVIAVGPGLGMDAWARNLLAALLDQPQPLVVDADALNLLAGQSRRRGNWVLTPHPGEAAHLLGTGNAQVQSDRLQAMADICQRHGGVVVLKGRGTLVGRSGDLPYLIDAGNPGMASAGMGDVLTGIIAGIVAQQRPDQLLDAAACAAFVHASAADDAARTGERGLIAGDLFTSLRAWINPKP